MRDGKVGKIAVTFVTVVAVMMASAGMALAADMTVQAQSMTYTGKALFPSVTVKSGGDTLKRGTDYTVGYSNNVNAGKGTVRITGKGTYAGQKTTCTFDISPASIKGADINGVDASYKWTGKAVTPKPSVTLSGKELVEGDDYKLTYKDNVNGGTATVTVAGTGNYTGSLDVSFKITGQPAASSSSTAAKKPIASATVTVKDATYTGKAVTPAVTVKYGGTTLKRGTDYTVEYSNNVKVGTGTVKVTGKGSYTGAKSASFKIAKKEEPAAKKSILATTITVNDAYYTGKKVTPAVTVKYGKTTLKRGTDYTVTYTDNVKVGTGVARVTGKGAYEDSKSALFTISKKDAKVAMSKVTAAKMDPVYTTSLSAVTPNPSLSYAGQKLKKGTDYTVSYKNNTKPGTGTITVTGKGKYTGTKTVKFKLVNLGDDIARAACELAYSKQKHQTQDGKKYHGTKKYLAALKKVSKRVDSTKGRSCDVGVATILRASGFDTAIPESIHNPTNRQQKYLGYKSYGTAKHVGTSSKWKYVGTYKGGNIAYDKLQPGDVLLGKYQPKDNVWHILIYVGKDIPKEVYKDKLKGTDADVGAPTGNFVSAHWGGGLNKGSNAAPCISTAAWSLASQKNYEFEIFRCVKPSLKSYRAGNTVS